MGTVNPAQHDRLHFLDNLRSATIVCVVFFHASLAYINFVPTWWWVIDTQKSYALDIFALSTEIFRMPLLFLIGGYFATRGIARKSKSDYLKEKLTRIVAPWIIGILFLAPLIQYFYYLSRENNPPKYIYFWFNTFFDSAYTQAHFWFLGILALLSFMLLAVHYRYPALTKINSRASSPSVTFLLLFGLLQSAAFFGVNIFVDDYTSYMPIKYLIEVRITRLVLFASYFCLGVYAYKQQWFTTSGYIPKTKFWIPSSILLLAVYTGFKITYFNKMELLPIMALNAMLLCFFCLCAVFCMLAVFYRWANFSSALGSKVSANSYALYYIHLPIVLTYNLIVRDFSWNVYTKYIVVVSLSFITSYLVCQYILSRTPFFGKMKKPAQKEEVTLHSSLLSSEERI